MAQGSLLGKCPCSFFLAALLSAFELSGSLCWQHFSDLRSAFHHHRNHCSHKFFLKICHQFPLSQPATQSTTTVRVKYSWLLLILLDVKQSCANWYCFYVNGTRYCSIYQLWTRYCYMKAPRERDYLNNYLVSLHFRVLSRARGKVTVNKKIALQIDLYDDVRFFLLTLRSNTLHWEDFSL